MNETRDPEIYNSEFQHEAGHLIDEHMGYPSQSQEFKNAILEDQGLYDKSTLGGWTRFNDMLNDCTSSGAAADPHVSDILSSTFHNDPDVINGFENEGYPFYHHENEYWNREDIYTPGAETFADITGVRSSGNPVSSDFLNRHFPNTVGRYDRIIKGGLTQ